eukprot:7384610-Prymnesium_polylepis.1
MREKKRDERHGVWLTPHVCKGRRGVEFMTVARNAPASVAPVKVAGAGRRVPLPVGTTSTTCSCSRNSNRQSPSPVGLSVGRGE